MGSSLSWVKAGDFLGIFGHMVIFFCSAPSKVLNESLTLNVPSNHPIELNVELFDDVDTRGEGVHKLETVTVAVNSNERRVLFKYEKRNKHFVAHNS